METSVLKEGLKVNLINLHVHADFRILSCLFPTWLLTRTLTHSPVQLSTTNWKKRTVEKGHLYLPCLKMTDICKELSPR